MKRLSLATAGLAALVVPQMAVAQSAAPAPATSGGLGFYVGGFFGLTLLDDYDLDSEVDVLDVEVVSKVGGNVGASAGVSLPLGIADLRVEGEVAYRGNAADELDNPNLLGEGDPINDSSTTALSGMANGLVDFRLGQNFALTGGAGIGYARVTADVAGDFSGQNALIVDDASDNVIAYQLIAGVRYNIDAHLAVTADYRYFITDDVELEIPGLDGQDYESEYTTHNFNLGLAYKF